MKTDLALFAALALGPAMIGPLPAQAEMMVLSLCSGGTISVPLGGSPIPAGQNAPCCAKGCQSGERKKRLDRSQGA